MSAELAGNDAAVRSGREAGELLYAGDRTRVSRLWRAGENRSLIRKEVLGPDAVERARHELRMLGRLGGVSGVPRLAAGRVADSLLFDDARGVTLAAIIAEDALDDGPPGGPALTKFALELTGIVAGMHRVGVLHRDINPSNVLVCGSQRRPMLIDFDLASTLAEEFPGFAHHRKIVGTLPYLAPEQTGRTGMSVDERADLYALGATVYELATGVPPFPVGDPLRMVHDTLTRIPVRPAERNARLPNQLSRIVMRLLEKDPDRRYQSADGLAFDLARLREDVRLGRDEPFLLGERDFPRRLSAPSQLVGRTAETAALRTAFDGAMAGGSRGVLVTGPSGVGKTALVNGLRSVVTGRHGWFVTGKYDQYRHDGQSGAVTQALSALGRLLLAEGEVEVAGARARILGALGSNIGIAATVPELATLLDLSPARQEIAAAATAAIPQVQGMVDLLSAVASVERPVVIVLDDLQWARAVDIGVIDAVLADDRLAGVLLVAVYRDGEVGPTHPLTAAIARWQRLGAAPTTVRLANLPPADLARLLAEMLRLPAGEAADLAEAVGARSDGNPFDTVELVNALRRDGALVAGRTGWTWDAATIRRFVGQGDIVDLLAARIHQLPRASRELLEVMACLGGRVDIDLLRVAGGRNAASLDEDLVAPLEDGVLVSEQDGRPAVRFRHDRVQEAAHSRLAPALRRELHLTVARRLAASPVFSTIAAEQYLQAVDALTDIAVADPGERRAAAELFVGAATLLSVLNPPSADRYLTAATALLGAGDGLQVSSRDPLLVAAERQQHSVLYRMGRLTEADAVYELIERHCDDPTELVEPACVQVASLSNRAQPRAAVELGVTLLRRLGVQVPDDFTAEVSERSGEVTRWAAAPERAADLTRPESDDLVIRLTAMLLNGLCAPAFFLEPSIMAWLLLASLRLWTDHGPSTALVATLSSAPPSTILMGQGYRVGYEITKHALSVGAARGYEPGTSFARHCFSVLAAPWFEPLEDSIHQSQLAREGLIRGGDLQVACLTYQTSQPALLDSAPTLDSCSADVDAALVFASRTGNDHASSSYLPFRQLLRALRGSTGAWGSFGDDDFDEDTHLAGLAGNLMPVAFFHVYRALSAALFADMVNLIRHAAAGMRVLSHIVGLYPTALAHLLQGLALAERVRGAEPGDRPALLAELDVCLDWLDARAADAPGNFGHLATFLAAERAWADGDLTLAARSFDTARRDVGSRRRPWHQALITERAAAFQLTLGLEQSAKDLLIEARHRYVAWCATGKVRQLDERYPFLRSTVGGPGSVTSGRVAALPSMSADDIDLLAILRASQALSSETSPGRLRARLGEVLRAMTGATAVLMAERVDNSDDWLVFDTDGSTGHAVPLPEATGMLPVTALRYAQRTGEPLLVSDPARDDRFARDPYLSGLEHCSFLMVPIFSRQSLRAVLVLENRQRLGAFAAGGLDVVMLINGQLTVSLDNAQLYASLERKVAQRTAALEQANGKLEAMSHTDALTGLPNRRRFDETLTTEWRRAVRQSSPLGLAMIDLDRFKRYNDSYGHVEGDDCLREVAATMRDSLRGEPDVICRYGGEEFAAILPGADGAVSVRIAERLRTAVSGLRRPHAGNDSGIVTISVGVAAHVPQNSVPASDLVTVADVALYEAKTRGRNQVCQATW